MYKDRHPTSLHRAELRGERRKFTGFVSQPTVHRPDNKVYWRAFPRSAPVTSPGIAPLRDFLGALAIWSWAFSPLRDFSSVLAILDTSGTRSGLLTNSGSDG